MWCLSRNAGKTLYGTLRQHLGEVFDVGLLLKRLSRRRN